MLCVGARVAVESRCGSGSPTRLRAIGGDYPWRKWSFDRRVGGYFEESPGPLKDFLRLCAGRDKKPRQRVAVTNLIPLFLEKQGSDAVIALILHPEAAAAHFVYQGAQPLCIDRADIAVRVGRYLQRIFGDGELRSTLDDPVVAALYCG